MILYEASMKSFFQTLIFLGLLYYLFKFAFRFFAPILLTKVVKKAEKSFREKHDSFQQQQNQQQYSSHQSETSGSFESNKFPREKKKVGEYIDFEEIE